MQQRFQVFRIQNLQYEHGEPRQAPPTIDLSTFLDLLVPQNTEIAGVPAPPVHSQLDSVQAMPLLKRLLASDIR